MSFCVIDTRLVKEEFEMFVGLCQQLADQYSVHTFLLANDERRQVLSDTAPHFFSTVLRSLFNSFFLGVAKLTSPKKVSGQQQLSIQRIFSRVREAQGVEPEDALAVKRLEEIGARVKRLRDNALAHNNYSSIMSGSTSAELKEGDLDNFFRALQCFVTQMADRLGYPKNHENHTVFVVYPYDKQNSSSKLVQILKSAIETEIVNGVEVQQSETRLFSEYLKQTHGYIRSSSKGFEKKP